MHGRCDVSVVRSKLTYTHRPSASPCLACASRQSKLVAAAATTISLFLNQFILSEPTAGGALPLPVEVPSKQAAVRAWALRSVRGVV